MKLTIVKDDGVVGVDGVFYKIEPMVLPASLRVVQWNGTSGHEEWVDKANSFFNKLSKYEAIYTKWLEADARAKALAADPYLETPTEEVKKDQELRVKVYKEKAKQAGVSVDDHWYQSDPVSIIAYLRASALQISLPWKTLDGANMILDSALLYRIIRATFDLEVQLDSLEEQHLKDISESKTPKAYDPKTKWPVGYKK